MWLRTPAPEQRIPLGEALQDVCGLALPLAQQWQASLEMDVQAELAALPVTQLALRSILLTVLTVAIPRAGHGPVLLSAAQDGADIKLSVTCSASDASQAPLSDRDAAGLETAQTVAAFYGAQLSFPPQHRLQDLALRSRSRRPKQAAGAGRRRQRRLDRTR